ncbi:MAG: hypothetical protein Ta2B_10860 [Termitinemataceae bacterium]|nr:MAG: hypothetical protein Ta2B_10860 [Termitinemataceae bacterium]
MLMLNSITYSFAQGNNLFFPFSFDVYESGSLVQNATLSNRLNLNLNIPALDGLRLRSIAAYEAPLPPKGDFTDGKFNLGFGLYHQKTGSRLLYGGLQTTGLAKRGANVFSHQVPFLEAHTSSTADLKTSGLNAEDNMFYASLISPKIFDTFNLYAAALVPNATNTSQSNIENNIEWTGGSTVYVGSSSALRLEFFGTQKQLGERPADAWFSNKIYLEQRSLNYYAASLVWINPLVSFAADFAQSNVFSFGKDIYANAALRIGSNPWRLSFAIDGAGERYSSSAGTVVGAGFRSAAKFEWNIKPTSLFKISTALQSAGISKPFTKSDSTIYYRFPIAQNYFISPSQLSINIAHNAEDRKKITDSYLIKTALNAGPLRTSFDVTLKQNSIAEEGAVILPYSDLLSNKDFESLKFTASVSLPIFLLFMKVSCTETIYANKETFFGGSIYLSFSGKYGYLNLRLTNSDIEENDDWTFSVSWKIKYAKSNISFNTP